MKMKLQKKTSLNQIWGRDLLLKSTILPSFNKNVDINENETTEKDLRTARRNMPNSKYPEHDCLTKEFRKHFLDVLNYISLIP